MRRMRLRMKYLLNIKMPMKTYYAYYFRSYSGDVWSVTTTKDYKDVYDFMKNETPEEYDAFRSEWLDEWGEFKESYIKYKIYTKQEMWIKINGVKYPQKLKPHKEINGEVIY